jgi:hypothetical protein
MVMLAPDGVMAATEKIAGALQPGSKGVCVALITREKSYVLIIIMVVIIILTVIMIVIFTG